MISFFRKALSSWLVLGLLGLVMLAFIVTGVSDPSGMTGGTAAQGDALAKVGGSTIGSIDAEQRAQNALRAEQQQQPEGAPALSMAQFAAGGAFDEMFQQLVSGTALEQFARKVGLSASKRMVDGEIASIPAFRGPTGQFDENAMRAILAQQRISEAQLRQDIAADAIRRQILVPVSVGARAPDWLVAPYASLLLEQRTGLIGIVPTAAMEGGAAPTDQELASFYQRQASRYTIPERRVLRFALVGPEQVAAGAQPTEAEIAASYRRDAARYAPTERRSYMQAVADTEAKANALASAVRGGQPFDAAARAAGLTPSTIAAKTRTEVTELASAAVAGAVFGAGEGTVAAPARSDFGWHVAQVTAIERQAGRALPQVREEIATALRADKTKQALADLAARIDDALAGGASFDEVATREKLEVQTTPAVTAAGLAVDQAGYALAPELKPVLTQGFELAADDDPVVAVIVPQERFALVGVSRVVPAAAPPLASIRDRVAQDFAADRAHARAKSVAEAIIAKAKSGTALPAAFAAAPVKIGAPVETGGRRADLVQNGQSAPPPLRTLFTMTNGAVELLEAPGRLGWWVIQLNRIIPGDARGAPELIAMTRTQFGRILGEEYANQFAAAARAEVGVTIDQSKVQQLKARLAGGVTP